jgi:hypothetical protein
MYSKKEISNILRCSESKAYSILRKLQELLKEEKPEVIIVKGRIPINYFEKKILGMEW